MTAMLDMAATALLTLVAVVEVVAHNTVVAVPEL
jgi:hypothetical protein